MKRLQISITEELDDLLGAEAARSGRSKAALVRELVADKLATDLAGDPFDDLVGSVETDLGGESIDDVVYGTR
jgi:hypothetical protein